MARPSLTLAALVIVSAACISVIADPSLASPSSFAAPLAGADDDIDPGPAISAVDGAVSDGLTVFDDGVPAVGNLDPDLLDALRNAAFTAADAGVEFVVNSGWRSPRYQEQLRREAVTEYGSEQEAARWVASPTTSAHVFGHAVDIGPPSAATWLSGNGADYGLCQIYANEPWHYELRPDANTEGCPPMYADPTQDPRTQQ
jgi:hypothetical protein